jgi:hypothetical protein
MTTENTWSRRVALDEVPEQGLHVELEADASIRTALALKARIRDLPRLTARFDLYRNGRDGLHVTGEVSGIAGQNCVVTLEQIEQNIVEPIDLIFVSETGGSLGNSQGEASFGIAEAEPPEPLVGGTVDLGAIATEYFLLGIDPYPRKEGVVFETASAGDAAPNPFAVLAALKKPTRTE